MKKLILLLFISTTLIAQTPANNPTEKPELHEFVISNFRTESGVTLPQARVVYGTYGHLNAAKDNVVLLPSHYMADFHGYEWLIRPDRALDRRIRQECELFLFACLEHGVGFAVDNVVTVLDGDDRRDPLGFAELPNGHVAQPDVTDLPFPLELDQRAE